MSNLFGALFGFNAVQRPQDVKGADTSVTDVKKGEGIGFQSLLQLFSSRMVSKLGTIKNNQMIDAGPNALEREKEGLDKTRKGKAFLWKEGEVKEAVVDFSRIVGEGVWGPDSDVSKMLRPEDVKYKQQDQEGVMYHVVKTKKTSSIKGNEDIQTKTTLKNISKETNLVPSIKSPQESIPSHLKNLDVKEIKSKVSIEGLRVGRESITSKVGVKGIQTVPKNTAASNPVPENQIEIAQKENVGTAEKSERTGLQGGQRGPAPEHFQMADGERHPVQGKILRSNYKMEDESGSKSNLTEGKGKRHVLKMSVQRGTMQGEGFQDRLSKVSRSNPVSVPIKGEMANEGLRVGRESITSKVDVKGIQTVPKNTAASNPVLENQIEIAQKENGGMAEKSERTGLQGGQRGPAPEHFQIVDDERHPVQGKMLRSNKKMDDESGSKGDLTEGKEKRHVLKMSVQRGTMQGEGFQDRLSKVSRSNPVSVPIKGEMANEGLRVGRESITSKIDVKGFQSVPKNTAASNPVKENQIEIAQTENVGTADKSERTGLQGGQRGPAPEHFQMVDGERHSFQGKILRSNNKMDDESGSKSNLTEGEGKKNVLKMSGQRGTMQGEGFQDRLSMVSRSNPVSVPLKGGMSNSSPLRDSIMDQIASSMTNTIRAGRSRVTIILRPEEMGRLRMELMSKNGIIEAKFFVESNEVKQMIEGSLSDLKTGLEKEGVQVENFNVDVDREFSHLSGQHERLTKKDNPYFRQDKRAKGDAYREEKEREGYVRQRYFGYNSMEIFA